MEVIGERYALAALPWEKGWVGLSQSGCYGGRVEKNFFSLQRFELWIIQPTA
jgi:hypothetical protein